MHNDYNFGVEPIIDKMYFTRRPTVHNRVVFNT